MMSAHKLRKRQAEEWWAQWVEKHSDKVEIHDLFLCLLKLLENKNGRIVDLGCGPGNLLYALKESGCKDLHGLELSEIAATQAKRKGFEIVIADIDQGTPYIQNSFDTATMTEVLEHMFYPEKALIEINGILRKNGCLLLTVPNAGWFLNGLLLTFFPQYILLSTAFASWTHCNQYTIHRLNTELEQCGFNVEKISGIRYVLQPPSPETIKKLHISPRKALIARSFLNLLFAFLAPFSRRFPSAFSPTSLLKPEKHEINN